VSRLRAGSSTSDTHEDPYAPPPEAAATHLVRKPHAALERVDLDARLRLDVAADILEEEDERVDRLEGRELGLLE